MVGRKTKLTKDLMQEAERLLKLGVYTNVVCDYLGIHRSTWYRWIEDGEEAKIGLKREFCDMVVRAESHAEIRNLKIIQLEAENGNWNAARWFLEHKFPKRWGNRQELNLTGEVTQKVRNEVDLSKLSIEEIETLRELHAKLEEDTD